MKRRSAQIIDLPAARRAVGDAVGDTLLIAVLKISDQVHSRKPARERLAAIDRIAETVLQKRVGDAR